MGKSIGIVPLRDYVVVLPEEANETSPGGIVLPEAAKAQPCRGKVMEVGPGNPKSTGIEEPSVKKDDVVVYGRFAGTDIEHNGKIYKLMREEDIFAKIEE